MSKKIHFIGIGGIGMSALAEIALSQGDSVSGSDLRPNHITRKLEEEGAVIFGGHSAGNISPDLDLVVRSTCISPDNEEIIKARESGIRIIHRSELLGRVMAAADTSVAVTGTHGKTTTSALVSYIMDHCGKEPTFIIGGEVPRLGGNARSGAGGILIAEVDESDGSFRDIKADAVILTNIEREHMEHHGNMENLLGSYKDFIKGVPDDGLVVYNGEDAGASGIAAFAGARSISFGSSSSGDHHYSYKDLFCARSISFSMLRQGTCLGVVRSELFGRYNAMNILSAMALCMEMGVGFEQAAEAVRMFDGVKRRFDFVDRIGNIDVVEDYAHHPTELKAVIRAAREYSDGGRVLVVFQPHRYSRTNDLADEFVHSFDDADILLLTDTYAADEAPAGGKGVRDIFDSIDRSGFDLVDLVDKKRIPGYVSALAEPGDIILVLGAGDIREIAAPLASAVRAVRGDA